MSSRKPFHSIEGATKKYCDWAIILHNLTTRRHCCPEWSYHTANCPLTMRPSIMNSSKGKQQPLKKCWMSQFSPAVIFLSHLQGQLSIKMITIVKHWGGGCMDQSGQIIFLPTWGLTMGQNRASKKPWAIAMWHNFACPFKTYLSYFRFVMMYITFLLYKH